MIFYKNEIYCGHGQEDMTLDNKILYINKT